MDRMDQKSEWGAVLIAALLIMSMVLLTALSLSQIALKGTANTRQIERSEVALAAAEGAVYDVLVRFKREPEYGSVSVTESYSVGDATLEVTTTTSGPLRTITALSTVWRTTVRINATYDPATKAFTLSQVAP